MVLSALKALRSIVMSFKFILFLAPDCLMLYTISPVLEKVSPGLYIVLARDVSRLIATIGSSTTLIVYYAVKPSYETIIS